MDATGRSADEITAELRAFHAVRATEIFCHLSPHAALKLYGAFDRQKRARGEVVITQGDRGDTFFIVVNGTLRVERDGVVVDKRGPD
jgi:CRP-like cAMP-binding protein